MAKVKRGGESRGTILDKNSKSNRKPKRAAANRGKDASKKPKRAKLVPPISEVFEPPRPLTRLEQIDRRMRIGLDRVCYALQIESSNTMELALKLLTGSVKELLKWVDPSAMPELEWIRWAAACVFIAQKSKNIAVYPNEHKSLRSILSLVAPETLLGFLERCDCVFSATDPLVWSDTEMMTSAVKNVGRFRRSVAMTFTLKKTFERLFMQMLSTVGPAVSVDVADQELSARICWIVWCVLRKQLWKTLTNPTELLHSQLAFLYALVASPNPSKASAPSSTPLDDRATPPDAVPALVPLSGNSTAPAVDTKLNLTASDGQITIEDFISRVYGPSSASLESTVILQMAQGIQNSAPETVKPVFDNRLCISADHATLVSVLELANTLYIEESNKELMGFDERSNLLYRFEGDAVIGHVRKDNCAIWVCQQVNRYSRQLFSEGTRKVMRTCIPDPTEDIETRVEGMVIEFGAHCADGVSDYRGTTALYSAFFDAIVDSEMKQELMGGALLRSDIFHRSLFAVAAHAMGYFADIPKYPEVLSICKVPALDFFKAGFLLVENVPQLLPNVIKERVLEAMLDVVHRRGWRQSERFTSLMASEASAGLTSRLSSSSSASSSGAEHPFKPAAIVSGDEVFWLKVQNEVHSTMLQVASASGMLALMNGRTVLCKALALANLTLKDDAMMRNRNLRTIAMCSLYCSARAHQMTQISFESLLRALLDLVPPHRTKELQMDLSIIEIDESHKGHVIDFYNTTFLPHGKRQIEKAGLASQSVKEPLAREEKVELLRRMSPAHSKLLEEPRPLTTTAASAASFHVSPKGLSGLSFLAKSNILFGLGFNRKFFAYD